jgi:polygalacturonase
MTRVILLSAILVLGRLSSFSAEPVSTGARTLSRTLNIRDFGAQGNGKTKDTAAIQKALDACTKAGGGSVTVPAGTYLTGSVVMGPNTTLQLDPKASLTGSPDLEDYPLVRVRWEGEFSPGHRALICAENAGNIAIKGAGSIVGPPLSLSRLRDPRGPTLIELTSCTNVLLEGFSTQYQQLWSIHPLFCQNFTARKLTLRSVNVNGDGIDVDSCRDVLIEHCDINTGDDAIALKSGRGMEAVRLARPTENVVIRNCTLISSMFGGLGIGTEMSGGVRNVRVENCTISGRKNSILIKSREGRGGFMEDITCENLIIQNSPNFLSIDLLARGIQATEPVMNPAQKWARVRNLTFKNITLNQVGELVSAKNVSSESPVEGLTLANISGDCRKGITLVNVNNATLSDIRVSGYQGELLVTNNVSLRAMNAQPPQNPNPN